HEMIELVDEAQRAFAQYREERLRYLQEMEAWQAAQEDGADLPRPVPPEPVPEPTGDMTEIRSGYPVRLAPGEYRIRLLDDAGRIVPDTEKRAVVFPSKTAVGYQLIVDNHWPLRS